MMNHKEIIATCLYDVFCCNDSLLYGGKLDTTRNLNVHVEYHEIH